MRYVQTSQDDGGNKENYVPSIILTLLCESRTVRLLPVHVCHVPDFLLRNNTATPWQGGRWKSEVFGTRLAPNITSLSPDKLRTERCLSAFFLLDREEVFDGVVLEEKTHMQPMFYPRFIEQDHS